jgi:hypothetical protein
MSRKFVASVATALILSLSAISANAAVQYHGGPKSFETVSVGP